MRDLATLCQDIVKQVRVLRNVARTHKNNLGTDGIDPDLMTPYQRGRMTRASDKLGRDLYELYLDHGQKKIMFSFVAFIDGHKIRGTQFAKSTLSLWTTLGNICRKMMLENEVSMDQLISMISHVGTMIDEPLGKAPNRVMLMKLSI